MSLGETADLQSDLQSNSIGFAVGGAHDVNTFRECIQNGIMPSLGSVTYNGLLYEYYFDTKKRDAINTETKTEEIKTDDDGSMLFYPSYCYARVNKLEFDDTKDSDNNNDDEYEYYMSVGLNSNIKEKDFTRKLLNLVIVLDKSGSMSEYFNNERIKTKMGIANECIVGLLQHLTPKDRFGLIVFDNESSIQQNLDFIENINMHKLKAEILNIEASKGTFFECGYNAAIKLYLDNNVQIDEEYDNRIIFLTDAHPSHVKTNPKSLFGLVDENANNKHNYIYTTFIGVGLDFNAQLIEEISNTRGCNYYSVKSTDDFKQVMDQDFEYMVTPLVFNVSLKLKSEGNCCCIEKVYGTTNKNEQNMVKTGEITKINTLFPSKKSKSKGGTKGGIQLIKLKNNGDNKGKFNVEIEVIFEDKFGKTYKNEQYVTFKTDGVESGTDMIENINYYDNAAIRKAILLCKYAQILMDWIKHQRVNDDKYKKIFNQFIPHFEKEMNECNDNDLQKELDLLNKLVNTDFRVQNDLRNEKIANGSSQLYQDIKSKKKTIDLSSFELLSTLGRGSFGRVRLVKYKGSINDEYFAMKMMRKTRIIEMKQENHIKWEQQILSSIRHPFIVNLEGIFEDKLCLYFVLELISGGEFFTLLKRAGTLQLPHCAFYASQIVLVFQFLHHNRIVYRNLIPQNILIGVDGYLRLTDFGFAKRLDKPYRTWTLCGTREYIAPEIILNIGHSFSADWWSLGILLFEMFSGNPPFVDDNNNPIIIYQKILNCNIEWPLDPSTNKHIIPKRAREFISRLLCKNVSQRLGNLENRAVDVMKHSFFEGVNWKKVLQKSIKKVPWKPQIKDVFDTQHFDDYDENTDTEYQQLDDIIM